MIGVSVLVKGTSTGVVTDVNGNFSLSVPKNSVLSISYIGYKSQEISINGAKKLNIEMEPEAQNLDEVVVVAYGQQKKAMLAYALALHTPLTLLDEPTNGLDITSRQALKRIISRTVDDESTLFISTHQAHDFENLLDHLIILSEGEILLNRSLDEISERLLFVRTAYLPEDSLYSEQDLHGYFSILPNEEGEENTPDIELLYKAVLQVPEKIKMIWNE